MGAACIVAGTVFARADSPPQRRAWGRAREGVAEVADCLRSSPLSGSRFSQPAVARAPGRGPGLQPRRRGRRRRRRRRIRQPRRELGRCRKSYGGGGDGGFLSSLLFLLLFDHPLFGIALLLVSRATSPTAGCREDCQEGQVRERRPTRAHSRGRQKGMPLTEGSRRAAPWKPCGPTTRPSPRSPSRTFSTRCMRRPTRPGGRRRSIASPLISRPRPGRRWPVAPASVPAAPRRSRSS